VRWVSLVASSLAFGLASGHAWATPSAPPAPREDASATDFWRELIEPHSATVTAIVAKARSALDKLDGPDAERAVDRRVRALGDAYGMLRYARKLAPENPEVLGLLGTTADELGKTRQALEALEACVRIEGPERAGGSVTGRLGMIYLRMGRLDDAIRWLRYAQGPIAGAAAADNAAAAVHLATALAARGQMPDALDVLSNAMPAQTNYFTDPVALVSFALAVHYDRDEQRGAAFDVLDRMQATLQQELGSHTQRALSAMRFAPPEDQYYYQALLYETLGDYTEARAEWALYAAIDDAPWRRRALEHVKAIDAQRSARPGAAPSPRNRRLGSRNSVPRTTK
jgi:tetratricopeptide (TPR) repeat protein